MERRVNHTALSGKYPSWLFVVFPALAMMLGWGLRGHIGGGPFGAMIPGAFVALSLALLLELPAAATSVLLVFAVFGIGMGGEMTYGQTLGFLRNPETVWWGTAGTTLKGAVWGLLGGALLSMGFVFARIPKRTTVIAILLLFLGMFVGFKLINDPMLLYFSDPAKPRPESWAALGFGAVFLLIYLKIKIAAPDFKIIFRFAFIGMIGGALGFGLGGFWMVLGSRLPGTIFTDWWKAMEFTFGLLLGASLGYTAWLNRKAIVEAANVKPPTKAVIFPAHEELGITLVAALLVHWLIPHTLEPFFDSARGSSGFFVSVLWEIIRIVVNYAFYGFLFVLLLIRFPKIGWQIGITLTFSHAAIDLFRDFYPGVNTWSPFTLHFLFVFLTTAIVALLTVYLSRKEKATKYLFLLLIWSCILISTMRLTIHPSGLNTSGLSFCQAVCGKYVVDIFFVFSAIAVSLIMRWKFTLDKNLS